MYTGLLLTGICEYIDLRSRLTPYIRVFSAPIQRSRRIRNWTIKGGWLTVKLGGKSKVANNPELKSLDAKDFSNLSLIASKLGCFLLNDWSDYMFFSEKFKKRPRKKHTLPSILAISSSVFLTSTSSIVDILFSVFGNDFSPCCSLKSSDFRQKWLKLQTLKPEQTRNASYSVVACWMKWHIQFTCFWPGDLHLEKRRRLFKFSKQFKIYNFIRGHKTKRNKRQKSTLV